MRHFLIFKEISNEQLTPGLIGGKASSLAHLNQKGFFVPEGFVITTEFFDTYSTGNKSIEFSDQDIKTINLKMAVIVQNMIAAEVSGVAFSTHPVGGDKDSMVIEAVLGSNELLVQGAITPDLYIVGKDFTILDKKIVPQAENYQQKLSNDQIFEVARLVADVRRLFNTDIDMEWAIENGKIYILQSRPVTAIQ